MLIYLIVNHVTWKIYVGQHKGNNLQKYLQQKLSQAWYELKRGCGGSSYLFRSMRKHPKDVWSIHPLLSDIQTKVELDQHEKLLIKALAAQNHEIGYNICRGGEGFTGPHSEESKNKTSKSLKAKGHRPTSEATASSTHVRREIHKQSGLWPGSPLKGMVGTTVHGVNISNRLANAEDGDAVWECRCVCGKIFSARGGSLRSGHTKSCGCLKAEQDQSNLAFGSSVKDMSGTTVNGIKVLLRVGSVKRKNGRCRDTTWSCRCWCGVKFVARGYRLRTGLTKSCDEH
jgi:hypothetical protein